MTRSRQDKVTQAGTGQDRTEHGLARLGDARQGTTGHCTDGQDEARHDTTRQVAVSSCQPYAISEALLATHREVGRRNLTFQTCWNDARRFWCQASANRWTDAVVYRDVEA